MGVTQGRETTKGTQPIAKNFRYVVIVDFQQADGLKVIDLGAGHASSGETLVGRVIAALKSQGLLSESAGAGYIERSWPPALKESGAWPLASLRQSFANGALIRLLDPETVLCTKIAEFVAKGDFGLASGQRPDGSFERVWYVEPLPVDEIGFDAGVFLVTRKKAQALKSGEAPKPVQTTVPMPEPESPAADQPVAVELFSPVAATQTVMLQLVGTLPPEVWNLLGTKVLPKLRNGKTFASASTSPSRLTLNSPKARRRIFGRSWKSSHSTVKTGLRRRELRSGEGLCFRLLVRSW